MQRLFLSAAILLSASAAAQTTINIAMPNSQGSCTYTTGPILSSPSVPGQLQATASSMTGTGCITGGGTTAVSFGPASPLTPALSTLSNTGGPLALSFQPVGAATCTGTITGDDTAGTFTGGGSTATICSSATTPCTGVQNVSTTFAANTDTVNDKHYTVTASCSAASGAPVTSQAAVTVSHGFVASGCPVIHGAGSQTYTQLTGNKTVFYFGMGAGTGNQTVNVTDFTSFWEAAWPGVNGKTLEVSLPSSAYLSMKFTVPANYFAGVAGTTYGKYYAQNTDFQADLSMTISTDCGDFSPAASTGSTVVPGCYVNSAGPNAAMFWHTPSGSTCKLQNGGTYYLNFINANIGNVTKTGGTATSTCATANCINPLVNSGSF